LKISELAPGTQLYTQLSGHVIAVLSRRIDGWCVYVDAVPGISHDEEWQEVARSGDKTNKKVATAIVETLFHPGFDVEDLPYAF